MDGEDVSFMYEHNPTQLKLSGWMQLPGSFSVMEALLRGEFRPTDTRKLSLQIVNVFEHAQKLNAANAMSVKTLLLLLSLAGTIRKVLFYVDYSYTSGSIDPPVMLHLEHNLIKFIANVQQWGLQQGCPVMTDETTSINSPSAADGLSQHLEASGAQHERLRQRLVSTLLLIYVQERNKDARACEQGRVKIPDDGFSSDEHTATAHRLGISRDACSELLLVSCGKPRTKTEEEEHGRKVMFMWERFAVKQHRGRFLPGCCSLGCRSLAGVSEAALPTQLCSGCMLARYCSVKCQREAWTDGGHSRVCSSPPTA